MNDREYYITRADGRQEGPYTEEQLVSRINAGKYPPDTLVWTEGMDDWAELSRLFPIDEKTEQPDSAADSSEQSTSLKAQHTHYLCIKDKILTLWKTNLKWCVASCGIVVCILAGLFCININSYPSRDEARKLLAEEGVNITSYSKALTQAIKIKDTELIKLLFIAGLDDDGLEKSIKFCIEENHIELASFILSNSHNSKLFSQYALDTVTYNRPKILKSFLALNNINLKDSKALAAAAGLNRIECLRLLLGKPELIDINYYSPLSEAAKEGHSKCVRLLIEAGADVNAKGYDEHTPLYQASVRGHSKCVRLLLEAQGIDVNKENPLYAAAERGHSECVRQLLSAPGIDVNKGNPLYAAAERGNSECVRLLLEAQGIDVNAKDNNNQTPLIAAVRNGHANCVTHLLTTQNLDVELVTEAFKTAIAHSQGKCAQILLQDSRINISYLPNIVQAIIKNETATLQEMPSISIHNKYKDITPLQLACLLNRPQCVRILLATPGIDVNAGWPLHDAAMNGHAECVRLLLAVTPAIDVNKGNFTPLHYAAMNGHAECVRLLISAPKIRVNKVTNDYDDKKSALHYAAENGHTECVRLLLTSPDINVNNEAEDHITALYLAAANGHTKCVQLLLAAPKIDVNTVYRSGLIYKTPLSGAAENGHTECVRMLLAAPGIEVNNGNALYSAVAYGHIECVRLLLAAPGIDPNQKGGNYNRRPLKIAKSRRDAKCERLLIAAGAKE